MKKSTMVALKAFREAAGDLVAAATDAQGDISTAGIEGMETNRSDYDEDELIEQLSAIYTPIMVTQNIDTTLADRVTEACAYSGLLTENNVIQFDDDTRKAQLVSLCSLLIARQSNSPDYQAYKQASKVRKAMKVKIQADNHATAVALADRYLDRMKQSAPNDTVRDAADKLSSVEIKIG